MIRQRKTGLPLYAAEFQKVPGQGTVQFEAEKLDYRIVNFIVGLNPAGASCEAVIPVTGSFETDLLLRQQKYRWRISLTSAPH